MINAATNQPFAFTDACVIIGARVGYDPAAAAAAHKSVDEFLKTLFSLN